MSFSRTAQLHRPNPWTGVVQCSVRVRPIAHVLSPLVYLMYLKQVYLFGTPVSLQTVLTHNTKINFLTSR